MSLYHEYICEKLSKLKMAELAKQQESTIIQLQDLTLTNLKDSSLAPENVNHIFFADLTKKDPKENRYAEKVWMKAIYGD